MKRSLVPARRRILHLPQGVARVYQSEAGVFSLKTLWGDLWLATEMQSLTPDLGLKPRPVAGKGSSARRSPDRVQDIRPVPVPARLDREFAKLARDHGTTPSVAIAFVMAWRAQHSPCPAE